MISCAPKYQIPFDNLQQVTTTSIGDLEKKQTIGTLDFNIADGAGFDDRRRVIKLFIEAASKFSSSIRSHGPRETRVLGDEKLECHLAAHSWRRWHGARGDELKSREKRGTLGSPEE